MSELNRRQDQIIEEFSIFDDWMDRYSFLIDIGKELNAFPEGLKSEQLLIKGCQSQVWLNSKLEDGKIIFEGDSDAIITRGIVALLIRVMSGLKPDEIMNADLYFIDKIGLRENLSPTRSNGLPAMVKQMKMYGLAYQAKLNS
jgi:cysteine desulfuration protein SufE